MPTFGSQPSDVVASSRGDVLQGVVLSIYGSNADATAGTNLLTTVTTNALGRWSYVSALFTVWAKTAAGDIYAVDDPTSLDATALVGPVADARLPVTAQAATLSSTYVRSNPPSWATAVNSFDPAFGSYNLNARTLARFRKAKARAVAGSGALHVSVLGDSTTMQATTTASAYVQAWPGRMRDHLIRTLGLTNGGTGLMGLWDLFNGWDFTADPAFPHLSWIKPPTAADGGALQKTGVGSMGIYGSNGVAVFSGATAPFTSVRLNPVGGQMVDQFWVYLLSGGYDTQVEITDGTTTYKFQIAAYYGATVTPDAGYTAVACEPGFVQSATPSSSGGIRVAKLTVPAQANWTATIHSKNGQVAYATMVEARLSTANLRVSNLAQGGMTLASIIAANNETAGNGGLPQGVDTPGADLAIIALGMNDWQTHGSVATFKANLTTVVQRQRFVGATGATLTGTGAGGDVLLFIQPQPDYTHPYPATGGNVPPLTNYWTAIYQVADEQNVALLDHSWRWTDYTTSAPMFRADGMHPNEIGHADIGVAVGSILARV